MKLLVGLNILLLAASAFLFFQNMKLQAVVNEKSSRLEIPAAVDHANSKIDKVSVPASTISTADSIAPSSSSTAPEPQPALVPSSEPQPTPDQVLAAAQAANDYQNEVAAATEKMQALLEKTRYQ